METVLDGGFSDPVLQSQAVFRAVMDALAHPGTAQDLIAPPAMQSQSNPQLASIMLALSDHDTAVWLDESLQHDAMRAFIGFHAGAPIVANPAKAVFAFSTNAQLLPQLHEFCLGTQEYPDRSTTIVLAVEALDGGEALTIIGPGIKQRGQISPIGLPAGFVAQWAANRDLFPRGIDLLLVANGQVMGLPRSTRIMGEN